MSMTILLIDDELAVLRVIRRSLRALGHDVLTAVGVDAGVEVYRQHYGEIDVLLIDMVMPGGGGAAVLRCCANWGRSSTASASWS